MYVYISFIASDALLSTENPGEAQMLLLEMRKLFTHLQKTNDLLISILNEHQVLKGTIEQNSKAITHLNIVVSECRVRLNTLEKAAVQPSLTSLSARDVILQPEISNSIIAEVQERFKRSSNLILYNIPDQSDTIDSDAARECLCNIHNINLELITVK